MSALIVTSSAPAPARGTAPSPGSVGGSAEDFAAALRDAATDAGHRPERGSDQEQPADSELAASSHPIAEEAVDPARADLPPAHLCGREGVFPAAEPADPLHADAAAAQDGPAVEPAQPLTQTRLPADGREQPAAHGRVALQAATSAAGAVDGEATTDASTPRQPEEAAVRPASAGGDAMARIVAEGAPRRPAQGPVAAQPGIAASGAIVVQDGAGAAHAAAPVAGSGRGDTSGPTASGAPSAASADPAAGALSDTGAGATTGARNGSSAAATHDPPNAQRVAESSALAPQPVASPTPVAAPNAADPAAAGSARPALLPQLAAPVIALARYPQGQHSITLTIAPENLGPVTVRAHISGSSIRLELHSPSDAGREALRVILADLRRDLSVAAPGASVDVSSRDAGSGSSPDPQGRSDPQGRFETPGRSEAQPRGDQQSRRPNDTGAAPGTTPAPAADIPPPPPAQSSAQARIDVYA